MNRLRITVIVGLTAVLAAVVVWMLQHGDTGSDGQHQQDTTATSQSRPVVSSDHSVAGGPSVPNGSAMSSSRTRHPVQVLPADGTISKPQALAGGLERVQFILNSRSNAAFADRVDAIRTIRTKLAETEMDAFSRYLRTPARDSQNSDGENWLRNEMLDALVQQADLPRGLAGLLIAVYQDAAQDPVMRDYAVQHMGAAYDHANAEEQAALQGTLWGATGETSSSIAGTALLALLNVAESNPAIDQNRLAATALRLAGDDQTGELARITAVQVCGRLEVPPALRVVEQLTRQSPSTPLRIAATAALGDYAMNGTGPESAEARNLLTRVAASSDPRQAMAAESALRRVTRARAALAQRTEQ